MKRSKTISVIVCLIMTLSFVLGSFSVAFAANNDGDSFIYSNSTYKYTFDQLLDEYLQTCDGLGTVFTYKDVFFVLKENVAYMPAYNKNVDGTDWATSFLGMADRVQIVEQATYIENHLGYIFELFPEHSLVKIVGGYPARTIATHYYTGADGNRLQSGGGGTGAGREHPYYTSPGTDNTLPSAGDNYYTGDTINTQIIDNSTGAFNNIGNGNVINAGEGDFIYNPDNRTWYVTNHNDNRTYTTNNYYTYNTVNYYMPGSDQPLNTWNYYYELPDGRNSATLTEEDIAGLNLDFDVVNYKQATEDLTQKALFHFDGNIENIAPPSNRGYTTGTDYFPLGNWSLIDNTAVDGDWSGAQTGYVTNYNFSTNSGTISSYRTSYAAQTGGGFSSSGVTFPAGEYLVTMNIDNLSTLGNANVYVFLTNANGDYTGNYGRVVLTSTSNSNVSVLCSVPYASNAVHLKIIINNNYAQYQLNISDIQIRKMEWVSSDGETFDSADFEFTQNASYTFVDTQTPFDAALYLDGTEHEAWIELPDDSFQSASDFTYSFRWYQEKSTSSVTHYMRLGRAQNTDLNCVYFTFNGSQLLLLGSYNNSGHQQAQINKAFLVGQWNTVTLVRTGNTLLLYLNGLQIASLTDSNMKFGGEYIQLDFAADSNVHYLDEILFATQSLYTENHVPRLIPWDTTNVLVLPEVTENSIAVMATIPITGYRIGGVRPTFPDTGMVWMLVEGDYITSIQIYNGYMWIEIGGAVYYNGHWYQLENFNIHVTFDDIDTPPGSDVVNPNKPSGGGSGSGSGGSGGGWLDTLFQELLSGVVDLIVEAIKALISLIENVLGAVADFIGACFSVITIPLEWMQPMGDFIGGLFAIFPSEIQLVYTAGFALIILCSVIMWISGKH